MRLSFRCPRCDRSVQTCVAPETPQVRCDCGWHQAVTTVDGDGTAVRRCLVCDNDDLWRQKDFPQRVGLAAIAVQIVLSTYFWFRREPLATYATLMAFAVADMVLFALMPDVLVCYRCRARHRTAARSPSDHGSFDHETAERYRQERLRSNAG